MLGIGVTNSAPCPKPNKPISYTPPPLISGTSNRGANPTFAPEVPALSDLSDPPAPLIGELLCKSARPSRRTSRTAFQSEPPDPDDPLLGFAPYLHSAPRRNSITPERQRAFISLLAATGIVTQAARSIGASLEALYRLRNLPGAEGFAGEVKGWSKIKGCVCRILAPLR